MSEQPKYFSLPIKKEARQQNIAIYKELTGRDSIPEDREYWTLCNEQPKDPGSEIMQLNNLGFLKKKQFFGVDNNPEIIESNRVLHPKANWIAGDWLTVIRRHALFNPAVVYLDTTHFADNWSASNIVVNTMLMCPSDTLLLVNVMMNDPHGWHGKFKPETLLRNIEKQIPPLELKKWTRKMGSEVPNYTYNATGHTLMRTYVFFKEKS